MIWRDTAGTLTEDRKVIGDDSVALRREPGFDKQPLRGMARVVVCTHTLHNRTTAPTQHHPPYHALKHAQRRSAISSGTVQLHYETITYRKCAGEDSVVDFLRDVILHHIVLCETCRGWIGVTHKTRREGHGCVSRTSHGATRAAGNVGVTARTSNAK